MRNNEAEARLGCIREALAPLQQTDMDGLMFHLLCNASEYWSCGEAFDVLAGIQAIATGKPRMSRGGWRKRARRAEQCGD